MDPWTLLVPDPVFQASPTSDAQGGDAARADCRPTPPPEPNRAGHGSKARPGSPARARGKEQSPRAGRWLWETISDARLKAVLRDMIAAIPGFNVYYALLPELKQALILIGSQERSRREADRLGKRLLIATVLATVVAVISLIVSIIVVASN